MYIESRSRVRGQAEDEGVGRKRKRRNRWMQKTGIWVPSQKKQTGLLLRHTQNWVFD